MPITLRRRLRMLISPYATPRFRRLMPLMPRLRRFRYSADFADAYAAPDADITLMLFRCLRYATPLPYCFTP